MRWHIIFLALMAACFAYPASPNTTNSRISQVSFIRTNASADFAASARAPYDKRQNSGSAQPTSGAVPDSDPTKARTVKDLLKVHMSAKSIIIGFGILAVVFLVCVGLGACTARMEARDEGEIGMRQVTNSTPIADVSEAEQASFGSNVPSPRYPRQIYGTCTYNQRRAGFGGIGSSRSQLPPPPYVIPPDYNESMFHRGGLDGAPPYSSQLEIIRE